jgi:TolB-like protein/Tfp pilus assembly protein PilF
MPEGDKKTPPKIAEEPVQIGETGFRALFTKLRKRHIIETLAAFIGGGWLLLEFVHWLLVDHYHFPEKSIDITFVTILGALICTMIWRWFSGREKPRKFKLELVLIPLVVLITVLLDINLLLHLKGPESETFPAAKWKNSIAVLPFVDMSPQKDQEYFCDGMTEDLINRLSNIRDLRVPARTSVFMFKGKTPDMRDVGEKLRVRTALEGSVQKSGDRLRITAQLINIADGYHLWSERYDRELKDVFAVQDEISSAIVGALRLKLTPQEKGRIAGHAITGNLEAYNLYLQGRYFWNKRMTDDLKKAIDYFNQAIALDPDFALAYSGLADSYLVLPQFAEYRMSEVLPKAKDAALKALAIDDALAEAHVSLASVKEAEWDDVAAENEYKRAIELNPNYPTGHHWYANLLDGMDRMDESLVEMKRALELDPLSPMINVTLAWLYLERREADQAIEQARKAVELDPNFVYSRYTLGLCLRLKGMFKEAVAELEKGRQLFGSSPSGLGDLGMAYALSGEKAKATEVLSILEKYSQRGYLVSSEIALVYLGLGEKDKALEWLDKVCDDEDEISYLRDSGYLEIEPEWDSLRSDPRYKKLLKKLRLE